MGAPPAYEAERPGPFAFHMRRWPAALRILASEKQLEAPIFDEDTIWRLTRHWLAPERKRVLRKAPWPTDEDERFVMWVLNTKGIYSWWSSSASWRSQREVQGWKALESELGCPHLEPFEIAQLRLTDDVSMDADVVLLAAWCQGLPKERVADMAVYRDHRKCILRGLRKLHQSPWLAFSIASPWMRPTGVLFPGASFVDASLRMERLLKNPLMATDTELPHILSSPGFKVAYRNATAARRGGGYILPAGPWYACGMATPLGEHFRRGGSRIRRPR